MIPLDRKNYPPPQGVSTLDDESDSDGYLPEPITLSEGDDSITIGNDANTLRYSSPKITSEGARLGRGPAK